MAPFVALYSRLNYTIASKQSERDLKSNLSTLCLNSFCSILVAFFPILCLNTSNNRELTVFKGSSFHFLDSPEFYQVLSYPEPKFIWSIGLKSVLPHGRGANITLSANLDVLFSYSAASSISQFSFIFALKKKNEMEFLDYLEMNDTDSISCALR